MSTSKRAKGGGGHDRHHALLVPPQALRDYAFLADGYRGAIIEVVQPSARWPTIF
jgi:hypothetical protein